MIDQNEVVRIIHNIAGEQPPRTGFIVSIGAQGDESSLNRTMEVMSVVAQQDPELWPSDDEWERILPAWFVTETQAHTREDIQRDENLWEFGSWLDSMKRRGWFWWSSHYSDGEWQAWLLAHEFVYSIGALRYLIYVAGGEITGIEEH